MATFIQINGRFLIPTEENLKKVENAKLPIEAQAKTVLPLETEVEIITDQDNSFISVSEDRDEITDLRRQYEEKFWKKAFNWWKSDKLKELLAE